MAEWPFEWQEWPVESLGAQSCSRAPLVNAGTGLSSTLPPQTAHGIVSSVQGANLCLMALIFELAHLPF